MCMMLSLPAAIGQVQRVKQTEVFHLLRNGKKIGEVTTTRVVSGNEITYSLQTKVQVKILLTINVIIDYQNVYDNTNTLSISNYVQEVNGLRNKDTQITSHKGSYLVLNHGNQVDKISHPISFTTLRLYFDEPRKTMEIFSENQMKNVLIKKVNANSYELTQSNGRKASYQYEEGHLARLESSSKYGTIAIVNQKHYQNGTY